MDLDTLTSTPENLPVFSLMNSSEKTAWLKSEAYKILDVLHINDFQSLDFLHKEIQKLDSDEMVLKGMLSGDLYSCAMCSKQYTKAAWLKKHLEKKHDFEFSKPDSARKESNPVQCFLFMSLLLRDTCDSYRMGDGERIVRNAYFEWLYARSLNHTKYSLWLWRLIAYVDAVLSPSESAEYKWNMTVNLKGGVQNNIPNDCCVELQVKNIKRQLNTQGSNKSFKSAQKICMTTQVVEDIMDKLQKSVKSFKPKGSRPEVDKSKDIDQIVQHLRKHGPVKSIKWDSFSKFKNPIAKISAPSLFEWINYNQKIASLYM
ncbi:hypothetical protein FSP39_014368 [Pinctada imbricata]|uniref:C2H2-type domain-containing protein n=1 Tax=Pinctada imbricata TaxID=66713 RepID=A0AA88XKA9_PINIB|nr:hypothetical protein FSP39_014368 [Pinctada imbricata]